MEILIASFSYKIKITDRIERTLICASGGACLGVLVAQLPGAIVGFIGAGLYGWYSETPDK